MRLRIEQGTVSNRFFHGNALSQRQRPSLLASGLIGLVLAGASPTAAEATHGLLLSQTDFNQTDGEKGKHLKTKNVDRLLTRKHHAMDRNSNASYIPRTRK